MRKFLALSTVILSSVLAAGCDGNKEKVTTKEQYPTVVEKPATVTETHTKEVQVHENEGAKP